MIADRIRETTTTTGTGTFTTLGAVAGFRTFLAGITTGLKSYYVCDGGAEWEVGIGTVTSGFLTRDTILASSNAGSAVSFSAGTKALYCDTPSAFLEPAPKVDTDASTITFDMSISDQHEVVLGGNRTLAVSNVKNGNRFTIKLIQDGTGSRLVTWFTTIRWVGGIAPTLTTTINKADYFAFIRASDGTYDGFILGLNY